MKLTKNEWLRSAGRQMRKGPSLVVLMAIVLLGIVLVQAAGAQAVSTTTVQGTVYLANGQAGSGTLHVSWPAFTTANGLAVAADSATVKIAADGYLSVNLAPNLGSTPAGLYYTAVFYMSDGTTSTQYWVVPSSAQASLAQVQSQLMPAAQAVQAVSKSYVDQSISELSQSLLTASGGTLSGPLYLNGDPAQALQASDKHYVDAAVSQSVPLSGGKMTGALSTPAVNGVQAPTANSSQATLQMAMSAAGANGAMEIPPTYAGTDGFTNPNGVRVTDLRTSGAQQAERSVKEFGALCDGVTDDTNALQTALNYAQAHGVALTIPQGTCKTRTLNWHGESIGGMGKQVSALLGYPGQDVLASQTDSPNLLQFTRLHDLTIYVDQSADVSCSPAEGRAAAGGCTISRLLESNSIFSRGGNGLTGVTGAGMGWAVGNCAIAMPAAMGTGGNGLRVAEIENVEIATTGVDPMAAQYPGAHSTHTCGMYLAQWPQWSEFRNVDIRGLNTGIAMPALPGTAPTGLSADSNLWQNITIEATHGFAAAAGSNNVLDNIVTMAGNSSAAGEPPTGLVLDLDGTQQGWTVRNAVVIPSWNAVQPQLTVTAAGGSVTAVTVGSEGGLGFDPYGTQVPLKFSGSCTATATASVNSDGSIGTISVTQGGAGCSGTTTASVNVAGTWDTAAAVNLIGGQSMTFIAGNLLKGNGGYTVWNAAGSESYGTQLNGGGGKLQGGGAYAALVGSNRVGTTYEVDQFPGADFGAKLQSCLSAVSAQFGGDCDARNFSGNLSMGANLTISTANTTVQLPCATIATANQIAVTAGTRNVALRGCALRGGSAASGSQGGTVFAYSGMGAMVQVGDPTYAIDTQGFHMDDVVINTTSAAGATAQGLVAYRTQEMDLESMYFLGNGNQTGMTLDGTGNYTGGTYFDDAFNGFQTAVNAIGHQVANAATTDWMNASAFVRLHIDCPTSGGSPIAGTYGINLQQGDGNTFTGGDVEGCSTALHLGANAQSNTIVGLRNENSSSQVVADAGSSYNNWMTGGTMFTGKLTDNGTRNSFLDTFHRSFNGMNGDWYGSQQDATVTNHFRIGTGAGNERGLLNRYQTDYGYRWTTGFSDATAGEQFYQVLDELNNVYRLSIGQYNNGQPGTNNQTVINAAGTGAVVLNGSNNSGTGGVVVGSGGASASTVATINNGGNALFNGTLQVGGTSTFLGTTSVKNQADAEIDEVLWAGATASQKESVTYKDWNGNSQWYAMKDASNNWALNSATGGLDSFKAYQSTNSGDTYVNASNASGAVRVNYESGAGTAFKIYGGNSSSLYASFTGTTSIQFPGLAAGSGHSCLQIDNSGYVTNTGAACGTGSGGSGTVGSANSGQIAYYTGNGTSVGGLTTVPLAAGGTGAATAAVALQNLGGISSTASSQQSMAGPLNVATAYTATTGQYQLSATRGLAGYVTPEIYGAWGDGIHDDTAAMQACWNASSSGSLTCRLAPLSGTYLVSGQLTLPHGAHVKGNSVVNTTTLKSEYNGAAVVMSPGVVNGVVMEDFALQLDPTLPNSAGFYFTAVATGTPAQGGLWDSRFLNISINTPAKECIRLDGGGVQPGYSFNFPNQADEFIHVTCEGAQGQSHPANLLEISGQMGQVLFLDSAFNGDGVQTGTNASTTYTNYPNPLVLLQPVGGNPANVGPGNVTFSGVSVQSGQIAYSLQYAPNITIDNGGHSEQIGTFVAAAGSRVSIHDDYFGNVGTTAIASLDQSVASIKDNTFSNASGYALAAFVSCADYSTALVEDNYQGDGAGSTPITSTANCVTQNLGITSSTFTAYSSTTLVNGDGGATPISTISGPIDPGKTITLFALGNSFELTSGGNISFGGYSAPLSIPQNTSVTLRRYDYGLTYMVESVNAAPTSAQIQSYIGSGVYDASGAAATAQSNAESYANNAISNIGVSTAYWSSGNLNTLYTYGTFVFNGSGTAGGPSTVVLICNVYPGGPPLGAAQNYTVQDCYDASSTSTGNWWRRASSGAGTWNSWINMSPPASVTGVREGNGSSADTAATSHNISLPANCVAASGSGTAYTCSTSPTFTPAAGDHIQFKADVANTGSATLGVNGATAATIKKLGGSGNLVANDLLSAHWVSATFDGSYWQLEGQLGQINATQVNGAVVPTSAVAVAANSSKQLIAATMAGAGSGIVTGPTSGTTTNDLVCENGTNGQVKDCGASLASPGAIAPTTVTATGIITGANDTTRTSTTTMTNSWTTTGLVLPTVPISTTKSGRCVIQWQMSSTSYTATFGIGMSNTPTGLWGGTSVIYAAAGTSNWLAFSQTATTTTAVSSATTAGATGTTYRAEIDFTLQTGATNPVAITVYGETSNSGGTLTIEPGSVCYWLP